MQYSYLQKQAIVSDLNSISGLSVVPISGVKDLTTIVWPNGLPGVVIPTPTSKKSIKLDSQHNDRVNTFELYLVFDGNELATPYDVERMTDIIMNAFDADQTLQGTAWPTVDAAVSDTATLQSGDKSFIVVTITLNCHTLIDIGIITGEAGGDGFDQNNNGFDQESFDQGGFNS